MQASTPDTLLLLPSLMGRPGSDGGIVLTRKFIAGVYEYAARWPGQVRVLVARTDEPDTNLDSVEVHAADLPFSLDWVPASGAELQRELAAARVALVTLIDRHTSLADVGGRLGTPVVYISEYSVQTRRQIVRARTTNPLLRLRREWWTQRLERRYENAVRAAAGVQCNGTPTFDAYHALSSRPLLYFDTRISHDLIVSDAVLDRRLASLDTPRSLRLAFSGRFVPMKGADVLPGLAAALRRRDVEFEMTLFGGGPEGPRIRAEIERHDVSNLVELRGVLDFHTQLVPELSETIDLFICPHRQGDPSCTYMETMSCGVPIVGFANEAWSGLQEQSDAGWCTPMNDIEAMADQVAALDQERSDIASAARRARDFAAARTFESTMAARVEHLLACCAAQQEVAA